MTSRILARLRDLGSEVYDMSQQPDGLSRSEDDLWTDVCALITQYQFTEPGLKTDGSVPYPWNPPREETK